MASDLSARVKRLRRFLEASGLEEDAATLRALSAERDALAARLAAVEGRVATFERMERLREVIAYAERFGRDPFEEYEELEALRAALAAAREGREGE